MGAAAPYAPATDIVAPVRVASAAVLLALATVIMLAGVAAFRAARTTVNPLQPQQTSTLVVGGVFRYTRNPMYLGMAVALAAWAAVLGKLWLLPGVLLFVLYMSRFQIAPEERAMETLFGDEWQHYRTQVRRWI